MTGVQTCALPICTREFVLSGKAVDPAKAAIFAKAVAQSRANLLRAANRIGGIRKGMEADLLLVDGNPLQDIAATERISLVVFKGERIRRAELFEQK